MSNTAHNRVAYIVSVIQSATFFSPFAVFSGSKIYSPLKVFMESSSSNTHTHIHANIIREIISPYTKKTC